MTRRLDPYLARRDFSRTPEPATAGSPSPLGLRYSIQNHDATRLHWDLRLEWDGVLLSWAITRGPSLDPGDKRLAVRTEDHPLDYLDFEGVIPEGNYGAGTVMLWDIGWWQPLDPVPRGLDKGHLRFVLHGRRLTGEWNLVRMDARRAADRGRQNWLLIKAEDEAAHGPDPVARWTRSVRSGRSFAQIAAGAPPVRVDRAGPLPAPVPPQLATLTDSLADPATHWHELKFDGYRALIGLGRGGPRVWTRSGLDWTDRFASLLPALDDLGCDSALIDGEIVAGAGLQGFAMLQQAIGQGGPFRLAAFDLLALDGRDLRDRPLGERRRALESLFAPVPPLGWVQLSPVIEGPADEAFRMICAGGGEGLIAKRRDGRYRSGRGTDWLKIKCRRRAEFVILGWQPSDSAGRPFASLALGAHRDGRLVYVGKVGTGFDEGAMQMLAERLGPLRSARAPVRAPAREVADVVWVRPELVAEVDYAELTAEGRLRHASFIALREDKPAAEVTLELATGQADGPGEDAPDHPDPPPTARRPRRPARRDDMSASVAGITITHPDRVIFPDRGTTKLDVARYYERVAPLMLDEIADRPLSFLRLPEGLEGERFFQKHTGKGFPDAIHTVEITESDGDSEPYPWVSDAAGIVAAVQMGVLEFHIWGARRDRLDRPDRLVFDLDPDEGLGFDAVRRAAEELRALLEGLGLRCWAMLSGGKGVHIVVPLRRTVGWDTAKLFCRGVATLCAAREPDRFTAEMSKARRKGRIFIDWLRNERGATAIAPFSLRARPGAPVATPVGWDELAGLGSAAAFDIATAAPRGWTITRPAPQGLTRAVVARLEAMLPGSDAGG